MLFLKIEEWWHDEILFLESLYNSCSRLKIQMKHSLKEFATAYKKLQASKQQLRCDTRFLLSKWNFFCVFGGNARKNCEENALVNM